ncbi:MAG: hypothetical protein HUU54_10235 [Ignavibacteriaceae bacterium]|nr:hypothetical protein [Ignavibacteriaceae bacterium]
MFEFKFTTLTPLHISNGETLDKDFNYTIHNGKMYKLDPFKVARVIAQKERPDFSNPINEKNIESWIRKHKLVLIDEASVYSLSYTSFFESDYKNPKALGKHRIGEFINSSGRFYIPASSVKGALLTILNVDSLGINPNDPVYTDKIVFLDSDPLSEQSLAVYRTEDRPPATNLICVKSGTTFSLQMRKTGKFDKASFLSNLYNYNNIQFTTLQREVAKYKSKKVGNLRKADLFLKAIEPIIASFNSGKKVVNIGFGGGSWFKVRKGVIPKFKSKVPGQTQYEAAHSTYAFPENQGLSHIGWCELEVIDR